MGQTEAIKYVTMGGALQSFMAISLLTTLLGLATMAVAIWRSGILPKWSGWLAFLGFALIPLPGVVLQFTANVLWGAAYFWMAYYVSKRYTKSLINNESVSGQLAA